MSTPRSSTSTLLSFASSTSSTSTLVSVPSASGDRGNISDTTFSAVDATVSGTPSNGSAGNIDQLDVLLLKLDSASPNMPNIPIPKVNYYGTTHQIIVLHGINGVAYESMLYNEEICNAFAIYEPCNTVDVPGLPYMDIVVLVPSVIRSRVSEAFALHFHTPWLATSSFADTKCGAFVLEMLLKKAGLKNPRYDPDYRVRIVISKLAVAVDPASSSIRGEQLAALRSEMDQWYRQATARRDYCFFIDGMYTSASFRYSGGGPYRIESSNSNGQETTSTCSIVRYKDQATVAR